MAADLSSPKGQELFAFGLTELARRREPPKAAVLSTAASGSATRTSTPPPETAEGAAGSFSGNGGGNGAAAAPADAAPAALSFTLRSRVISVADGGGGGGGGAAAHGGADVPARVLRSIGSAAAAVAVSRTFEHRSLSGKRPLLVASECGAGGGRGGDDIPPVPTRVLRGDPAAAAALRRFIEGKCVVIVRPTLPLDVFEELIAKVPAAGPQIDKDRGVWQSTTLDSWERENGVLGRYVKEYRAWAAGDDGSVVNDFWPINGGRTAAEKLGDPPEWRLKTKKAGAGDHEGGGAHVDNPTQGTKGVKNTGRILDYDMIAKMHGGLFVYRDGVEIKIDVPRGCAIYCDNELLALMHAHAADGRCLVKVTEVSRPEGVEGATAAEIAAAGAAQPQLPLHAYFGDWRPWEWFGGAVLKWGAGRGGGSGQRLVMTSLRGGKVAKGGRRLMTKKAARAAIAAMPRDEFVARAAAVSGKNGEAPRPRPPPSATSLCAAWGTDAALTLAQRAPRPCTTLRDATMTHSRPPPPPRAPPPLFPAGAVRTTDAGKAAPWVVLTGPSGVQMLVQLFPVIKETLIDHSHQLLTNLTVADGKAFGLDTTTFPKNINGKEVGFRIVRDSPKGWKLAGDGLGAADEQVVAGRPWETTARGELKKLAVREATRDEIAAGRV